MLRVCRLHQRESFVYHTNTKLDTSCIFSQTEPPRRVNAWRESVGVMYLSQRHNDALSSSDTESRRNLAVTNFRFYPLSCTVAMVGILAFSVFLKGTIAQYAQCRHRTSSLAVIIQRSKTDCSAPPLFSLIQD